MIPSPRCRAPIAMTTGIRETATTVVLATAMVPAAGLALTLRSVARRGPSRSEFPWRLRTSWSPRSFSRFRSRPHHSWRPNGGTAAPDSSTNRRLRHPSFLFHTARGLLLPWPSRPPSNLIVRCLPLHARRCGCMPSPRDRRGLRQERNVECHDPAEFRDERANLDGVCAASQRRACPRAGRAGLYRGIGQGHHGSGRP